MLEITDQLWFRSLAGGVIGLALGSFVTMLSYRVPRQFSIIKPGSHCPHCKAPLEIRDLVPVFSWLLMRGRCRFCGTQIGIRYPAIELIVAIASIAAFILVGFRLELVAALAGIVLFVALAAITGEKKN